MKTIGDFVRERRAEQDEVNQRFSEQTQKLLADSADLPLFVPTSPTDVSNYAEARRRVREAVNDGRVDFYQLVCDHCGTQLVNPEPHTVLLSNPPKKRVACPGCGWLGYLPTGA